VLPDPQRVPLAVAQAQVPLHHGLALGLVRARERRLRDARLRGNCRVFSTSHRRVADLAVLQAVRERDQLRIDYRQEAMLRSPTSSRVVGKPLRRGRVLQVRLPVSGPTALASGPTRAPTSEAVAVRTVSLRPTTGRGG